MKSYMTEEIRKMLDKMYAEITITPNDAEQQRKAEELKQWIVEAHGLLAAPPMKIVADKSAQLAKALAEAKVKEEKNKNHYYIPEKSKIHRSTFIGRGLNAIWEDIESSRAVTYTHDDLIEEHFGFLYFRLPSVAQPYRTIRVYKSAVTIMTACPFVKAWQGKCSQPGRPYCDTHQELKCFACHAQATTECEATTGALVCGVPECAHHPHDHSGW